MADRFTPPTMDWTSPGDLHKRFKFFEQKCDMIFKGPLKEVTEDGEKVNYMLLWAGDKALEIYNAYICLTSLTRAKCGTRSTLCWKVGNISGSTELFAL